MDQILVLSLIPIELIMWIRDSVLAAPVKFCGPYQGSYMVQE